MRVEKRDPRNRSGSVSSCRCHPVLGAAALSLQRGSRRSGFDLLCSRRASAVLSTLRSAWRKRRWYLLTVGILFASAITYLVSVALFVPEYGD
jgi:hypothetical protein